MGADAEEAFHQLGTLGAHQAAHAQDLALAQGEGDVPEALGVDGGEILHLQHLFPGNIFSGGIEVFQFPAHHLGDNHIGGQFLRRPGADVLTVTHDGDLVANAENLIHLMGNVHNGHILRLQVLDDSEQGLHLILGQRGGGLIQNQNPAVGGNSLGDFHRLHLRNAELSKLLLGIEIHPNLFQQLGGIGIHFIMVNHRDEAKELLHGVPTQENIFTHGTGGNGLKLLVNHGDSLFQRIHGVADGNGLSIDFDLAFIHFIDAEHTFHQGGFSRAVFSHQRVNLTGMKLQLSMVQCFHAWK